MDENEMRQASSVGAMAEAADPVDDAVCAGEHRHDGVGVDRPSTMEPV